MYRDTLPWRLRWLGGSERQIGAGGEIIRERFKERLMRAILDHCGAVPLEQRASGSVILEEGQKTGRVY
ncbi:MAG TPA: hypothetical protein VFC11_08935, partial [Methylocella sp.]|nr:hypothetical protein [Methylocella sp.]